VITSVLREAPPPGVGDEHAIPRIELREWAARFGLVAGVTTARNGFSLALSDAERWRAFEEHFRPRFPAVVFSRQVHGAKVHWYDPLPAGRHVGEGWDGHATGTAGILLTISVADCVPVYVVDPRSGVFALVHAGWRGTVGGILGEAVKLLEGRARSPVSSIAIHCGISICGACYEVGSEVANALGLGVPEGTKSRVDLRSHLAAQAWALGVRDITISPFCSAHDAGFHSHRASAGQAGRMIAYLGRPKT